MKTFARIMFVMMVLGISSGASLALAQCTADNHTGTLFFVSEMRGNYCGVASVMIVHQTAYNYIEGNTLAYEDQIAWDMGWLVRYGVIGANIPMVLKAAYDFTPYGWVYSEWEYVDIHEAIKGIAWTWARFRQPVIISGNTPNGADGFHYYVLNGVKTASTGNTCNAFNGYPVVSITGIYILDSLYGSPAYPNDPRALRPNSLFQQGTAYTIDDFVNIRWHKTGADGDKKYRSVEKGCPSCWSQQGVTFENNTVRSSY